MGSVERKKRSGESDLFFRALYKELGEPRGITLVAVGGYGRGELSPGSDLDLLILHNGKVPELSNLVNSFLYPIWDKQGPEGMPKKVDHSVRTLDETKAARNDLKVALGLLDARFIIGDQELFDQLIIDSLAYWKRNHLEELRLSMKARHERFGDLAYLLEPDIKEARGGLRDMSAIRAITRSEVIKFEESTLENINAMESKLLDIRDSLHQVSGRDKDQLLFHEQDKVAAELGYVDADALMGTVATIARSVEYQLNVAWHYFDNRKNRSFFRKTRPTSVGKNIAVENHEVVIEQIDPTVSMRAAAKASQLGLPISMDSCQLISSQNLGNPWPREAREDLVAFIGGGSAIERVWEALDQAGVIENWFPEWSKVRSLPQRNVLHRHTVDRHMVETAIQAAKLTRTVHRPDLLLVGALFHDIGKGTQADHSIRGAELIEPIATRIGFSKTEVETLKFLVLHHLLLPSIATRRDLDDPATIQQVMQLVPDLQHLELLHALSIADGEATGKAAWSDWKARLVNQLVNKVKHAMKGSLVAPAMELSEEQKSLTESGELSISVKESNDSYAIEIIAPDSTGLFSVVAGVLNLAKFDIRAAKTRTYQSAAAMNWLVNLDSFAKLPSESELLIAIQNGLADPATIRERIEAKARAYAPFGNVVVPAPEVEVIEDSGETATIIEIRSHDKPALLFTIGSEFQKMNIDIKSVIASTLGAEVIDTLYVTEINGEKLSQERAKEVAENIRLAID